MKLSSRIKRCGLSPMRQFYPSEVAAVSRGLKVYHMNIGQPDIETPPVFLEEVRRYQGPVVPYAPAPGEKAYLKAVQAYYGELGCALEEGEILATFGGSEALEIAMACILEEGDEVLVPEPF